MEIKVLFEILWLNPFVTNWVVLMIYFAKVIGKNLIFVSIIV